MKTAKLLFIVLVLHAGCQSGQPEVLEDDQSLFENGEELGEVDDLIDEASGLATSINNPGKLWTHNDSGGAPNIYLIDNKAQLQAIVTLEGIENRDWEDIVVGPGPDSSKWYLYMADIGDNSAKYKTKYIYRLEEPAIGSTETEVVNLSISDFDKIAFEYPDGKRDAETLFIDHKSKDLYVVSKREDSVNVYTTSYPQSTSEVNTLAKLGAIPFYNVVAGDMTANNEILLKTYKNNYYWKVNEGESVYSTLSSEPTMLPYKQEPQGESIAWARDGNGYYTLSEKAQMTTPKLLYYKRKH